MTNEQILELAKTCESISYGLDGDRMWLFYGDELLKFAREIREMGYNDGYDDGWHNGYDAAS